jgi:hypothetical protein
VPSCFVWSGFFRTCNFATAEPFFFFLSNLQPSSRSARSALTSDKMNEHLVERFGRSRRGNRPPPAHQVQVWMLPQQLNTNVREYFQDANKPVDGGAWLRRPEIPTSDEVLDIERGGSTSSGEVELSANLTKGQWPSKGKGHPGPK